MELEVLWKYSITSLNKHVKVKKVCIVVAIESVTVTSFVQVLGTLTEIITTCSILYFILSNDFAKLFLKAIESE